VPWSMNFILDCSNNYEEIFELNRKENYWMNYKISKACQISSDCWGLVGRFILETVWNMLSASNNENAQKYYQFLEDKINWKSSVK
jgi:hypothetical protein